MSNALAIITAITSLVIAVYVLFKSIKTINTPCFKIDVNGETQDANLIAFITHRFTPRTQQNQQQPAQSNQRFDSPIPNV